MVASDPPGSVTNIVERGYTCLPSYFNNDTLGLPRCLRYEDYPPAGLWAIASRTPSAELI
eukprot:6746453-Prorocentrum_lima.AAC.1